MHFQAVRPKNYFSQHNAGNGNKMNKKFLITTLLVIVTITTPPITKLT